MLFGKGLATSLLHHGATNDNHAYVPSSISAPSFLEYPMLLRLLKHQTIKCYFLGIRHGQITMGFDRRPICWTSHAPHGIHIERNQALTSRKQYTAQAQTAHHNHPAAKDVQGLGGLARVRRQYSVRHMLHRNILGFLRAVEFTTQSQAKYDPGCHLSLDRQPHSPNNHPHYHGPLLQKYLYWPSNSMFSSVHGHLP